MIKFYNPTLFPGKKITMQALAGVFFLCIFSFSASAQCPPNIDFEEGTFNNWQCFYQNVYTGGVPNPVTLTSPVPGRVDMYANPLPPGSDRDFYGGFPKNCPNGSGYSVRIGDATIGQHVDK